MSRVSRSAGRSPRVSSRTSRSVFKWLAAAAAVVFVAVTLGFILKPSSTAAPPGHLGPSTLAPAPHIDRSPSAGTRICGQPILRSPYAYSGRAGPFPSGTAGLPTYGKPGTDFPKDTAGEVLPVGTHYYPSYELKANTVYYLLPGIHIGGMQANKNDAFVGGFADGKATVLSGNYNPSQSVAIDSNYTAGNQAGVTVEYLTIEKFTPDTNAAAVNQEANTNWTVKYNTINFNVPGAGVIAGSDNTLQGNCMTQNGQYGFQSTDAAGFGSDSVTGGPYNVTVESNEISYNDTCDLEGRIDNPAAHLKDYNPVPARYRNAHCGSVTGDGNQGGFKLWETNGVTIKGNYIHNNWGPGGWADTNNANTTWTGNTITDNDGSGISEEISYNFSITGNYLAGNDIIEGLGNTDFPSPAIYISGSGSDRMFGGVPACPEASCSRQRAYPRESVVSHNTLVDNGGGVFLWQDSNRHCGDGSDSACTLVKTRLSGPFTIKSCRANLPSADIDTVTYVGNRTGSPPEDWYDGCMWKTENVTVNRNEIDFSPEHIRDCNPAVWRDCGAGGIYSEYGGPSGPGGWVIPTSITFFQNNHWRHNIYHGPSTFYAWNQGSGDNPVSWGSWTGALSEGDQCSSPDERQSGYCKGPFGQDAGSTFNQNPA